MFFAYEVLPDDVMDDEFIDEAPAEPIAPLPVFFDKASAPLMDS